jgi:transketolase
MEGVNHEAAASPAILARPAQRALGRQSHHHRRRDRSFHLEDIEARYRLMAGTSCRCDGLDAADVRRALDEALADPRRR